MTFAIFALLYSLIFVLTLSERNKQISLVLKSELEHLSNNHKVSDNHFKIMGENLFFTITRESHIMELFYKAKHSDSEVQRALLRAKLYEKMKPYFDELSKAGVNIIQFAFEDNKSFLRVHKPSQFDDDLSLVRYSIGYVNDTKKPVRGFEQGKISHAFRNVFPVFFKEEYVGCLDVSFSSEVLQDNMRELYGMDMHFIVNKSLFAANVYESDKNIKYVQSIEHKDFLFTLGNEQSENAHDTIIHKVSEVLKEQIAEGIASKDRFALYAHIDSQAYVVAFFPIKNIKDNCTVAYMVSYSANPYIHSLIVKHFIVNSAFIFAFILLAFLIASNINQRRNLQTKIDEAVEKNIQQTKQLLHQSRLAQMGEMISMIAHQWRQPLGAIAMACANIKLKIYMQTDDFRSKEDIEEYNKFIDSKLNNIETYVQNLTNVIDDFRDFNKPSSKAINVEIQTAYDKALKIILPSLLDSGIQIQSNFKTHANVKLYESELMQVFLNILQNAKDNFMEKSLQNPTIEVSSYEEDGYSIFKICDNGGGIPDEIIEVIFDPYFSTKREKNGTGLGLYMSKMIIQEHHNGDIYAINEDDGACFYIKLPIA